jgi:outer membrane protein TolC
LGVSPASVATIYDVAIQETGQNGVEQLLSNFDAIFNSTATWDSTDRAQNGNTVNAVDFQQDSVNLTNEISKRAANGSQLFFRNVNTYTGANNTTTNTITNPLVPSDWLTTLEAEIRQPLLRARGAQVNRVPIVLARIRTDIALADFEGSIGELVNTVEQAYWELYFSYRNLEASKTGRDSALGIWKKIYARYQSGDTGGEAEREAQAKEQYFFFRGRVEEAWLNLLKAENHIRYLMGLAATDGRLIRPLDEPTTARISFDWDSIHSEALDRHLELRRQRWQVKQRELELIAARNQLLPQFDAVALYRWLGAGDEFASSSAVAPIELNEGALDALLSGNRQEFRIGFEFEVPLGFRRELAQVRNQQLGLVRERARLEDMELEKSHQLTDAIQELEAQNVLLQTNFNRYNAADQGVAAVEEAFQVGTVALDLLLDSQRRRADAEVAYYQSLVNYNLAITRVHLRKGSLLDYNGVMLAEGPWPQKAYFDAQNRARQRDASWELDYGFSRPRVVSRGTGEEAGIRPASGQSVTQRESYPPAYDDGDNGDDREFGFDDEQDGDRPTPAEANDPFRDDPQSGDEYERVPAGEPLDVLPDGDEPSLDLELDYDSPGMPTMPEEPELEAKRPARTIKLIPDSKPRQNVRTRRRPAKEVSRASHDTELDILWND